MPDRSMTLSVLGLDIGGANLKAAHTCSAAVVRPFELWKQPGSLGDALRGLIAGLPPFDLLAVTMTGELCDCFETKQDGVNAILDAVATAAGALPVRVWRTDGTFAEIPAARATPLATAAANWLALATFAGRHAPEGPGLVIDVGSTTTDLVPLRDGRPVPRGRTDPERLRCGELVYTGARRTPLCALLGGAVAAEFFATTLDAYLVLGDVPEDAADHGTADGRPATRRAAHARLARILGADAETCPEAETLELAGQACGRQVRLVESALNRVIAHLGERPRTVVVAGSGEFLAWKVLARSSVLGAARMISLADQLGPEFSAAACAYAVAVLAAESAAPGGGVGS